MPLSVRPNITGPTLEFNAHHYNHKLHQLADNRIT